MKYFPFILIFLALNISCTVNKSNNSKELNSKTLATQSQTNENLSLTSDKKVTPSETPKEEEPKYPGVQIDEKFDLVETHNSNESELKEKIYNVDVEGFQIEFKGFTPKRVKKNNISLYKIKTLRAPYAAYGIGLSSLLGKESKQIFLDVGNGGMCCSNYWIIDISNKKARTIFRSEDYSYYRGGMEIFDAEGDGIYELVQFDGTFRYMMDDCGTCSPEPRAVFKYDKKKKQYIPAKGIHQDFVLEGFKESEKLIAENFDKLQEQKYDENDRTLEYELSQTVRSHVVDLIYFGDEKKAWKIFDKYFPKNSSKEETRAAIKERLKQSKFYQALKKKN